MLRHAWELIFAVALAAAPGMAARAADPQVERGKYLVDIIGCTDCHTPGSLLGRPDTANTLADRTWASPFPVMACSLVQT